MGSTTRFSLRNVHQCAITRDILPRNLRPSAKASPPLRPYADFGNRYAMLDERPRRKLDVDSEFQEVLNVSTPRASTPVADCVPRRKRNRGRALSERAGGRTDRSIALHEPPVVRSGPPSDRRMDIDDEQVWRSATATYLRKRRGECSCEGWDDRARFVLRFVPSPHPRRNVSRTELSRARPRRLPILPPVYVLETS